MRKGFLSTAVLLALGVVAGCGGGRESTGPTLDRTVVAGVYNLATLSFDPQGSLPKTDILDRLAPGDLPELVISKKNDTFQLIFRDPATSLMVVAEGNYTLLDGQVRLNFKKGEDARRLLLPERVEFNFNEAEAILSYRAYTNVSLMRLRELVPEFQNEQLPDPVYGELAVVFTLNRH